DSIRERREALDGEQLLPVAPATNPLLILFLAEMRWGRTSPPLHAGDLSVLIGLVDRWGTIRLIGEQIGLCPNGMIEPGRNTRLAATAIELLGLVDLLDPQRIV